MIKFVDMCQYGAEKLSSRVYTGPTLEGLVLFGVDIPLKTILQWSAISQFRDDPKAMESDPIKKRHWLFGVRFSVDWMFAQC